MVIISITFWAWLHRADPREGEVKSLALSAATGDTNALGKLKEFGPAAVPQLEALCLYKDLWRRCAWDLAPILPKQMGRKLVEKVGPLRDTGVRVAAIKTLGLLGPQAKPAIPTLLPVLHDPQSYIALEAGGSLGRIGSESLPGLIAALNDDNAVVRHAAAYGLGEAGPAAVAAVPALVKRLDDSDPQVRSSSASSLRLIRHDVPLRQSNLRNYGASHGPEPC
jgi:HEAT repeat protein